MVDGYPGPHNSPMVLGCRMVWVKSGMRFYSMCSGSLVREMAIEGGFPNGVQHRLRRNCDNCVPFKKMDIGMCCSSAMHRTERLRNTCLFFASVCSRKRAA